MSYRHGKNDSMACPNDADHLLEAPMHAALPIVAYLRVSTSRQGRSGLGIEAQRENIARFAASEGYEVIGEYVELETGKGADALYHISLIRTHEPTGVIRWT